MDLLSFEPAEASVSLFSRFPAELPGEPQTRFRRTSALALFAYRAISCSRGGAASGAAAGSGDGALRSEQVQVAPP